MPKSHSDVKSMLSRLSALGPKTVVITSVYTGTECYNAGYDSKTGRFWIVPFNRVNANYPGTGDIFAAVLTGGLLDGDSLPLAMNRASAFLEYSIKTTYGTGTETREGIDFEKCLGFLFENRSLYDYEVL